MRFRIELLIAEEHDAVRVDRVADFLHFPVGQRLAQIHIADFRPDMRTRLHYRDTVVRHLSNSS